MTGSEPDAATELQCAWCGKVRVAGGDFVPGPREERLDAERSHGICPSCLIRELGGVLEETGVPV